MGEGEWQRRLKALSLVEALVKEEDAHGGAGSRNHFEAVYTVVEAQLNSSQASLKEKARKVLELGKADGLEAAPSGGGKARFRRRHRAAKPVRRRRRAGGRSPGGAPTAGAERARESVRRPRPERTGACRWRPRHPPRLPPVSAALACSMAFRSAAASGAAGRGRRAYHACGTGGGGAVRAVWRHADGVD